MKRNKTALACISIVFLLLLGVGITLSWMTGRSRNKAEGAVMSAAIQNTPGAKVHVANYYSTESSDSGSASSRSRAISGYTEIDDDGTGFCVPDLEPGESVYFQTVITNDTTKEITVSLSLTDVCFSTSLRGYLHFVSGAVKTDDDTYEELIRTVEFAADESSQTGEYCVLASVPVAADIAVPADGTDPVVVEWQIRIDEKVEECRNVWIRIGAMQVDSEGE